MTSASDEYELVFGRVFWHFLFCQIFINTVEVIEPSNVAVSNGFIHTINGTLQPILNRCDVLTFDNQLVRCVVCVTFIDQRVFSEFEAFLYLFGLKSVFYLVSQT